MIEIALWAAHIAGWFAASVVGARWLADNQGRCHERATYRSTCRLYHQPDCWRADGEITLPRFAAASSLALAWPLLIAPALAWHLANKCPTAIGLQREIARLEREAGIS